VTPPPPPPFALDLALDVGAVVVSLTIPAGATKVWLRRVSPSGEDVYVRGVQDLTVVPSTELLIFDFEAPLGVNLDYFAKCGNASGESSTTETTESITVTSSPDDNPWIVDVGQPNNSQPILVEALAELSYAVPVGVHKVIGRRAPIVLSDIAGLPTFELAFATLTDAERENARATLGNGIPFLLRSPPEQGVGNMYISVLTWVEGRPSRIALHEERRFKVTCQQVDRPDPKLVVPVTMISSYLTVRDGFADYAAVKAQRSSYQALMLTYGGQGGSVIPWPEDDV
jgi:hypothetical protein